MWMRIASLILSLLFAAYTGWNGYTIASAGITNHITQLVGDGGGDVVFAVLVFLAGILGVWLFRTACVVDVLATAFAVFTGMIYQDTLTMVWGIGSFVLAVLAIVNFVQHRRCVVHTQAALGGQLTRRG